MKNIKVLLVDDHQIILDGIQTMLSSEPDISICGACITCKDAFEYILKHRPDVIITDINMPEMSGIELIKKIKSYNITAKILVLSMFASADYIQNAVNAGANGFLMKQNATRDELMTAIGQLMANKNYFNSEVANTIVTGIKPAFDDHDQFVKTHEKNLLSKRELQVLKLFAEGHTNKEISEKLFISLRTVETHKTKIISKLNMKSYVDLIKYAIRNKLCDL
ncbi:MAG TPA: response regulator transcription factor [Bacteroidales bacterium]|nr:response regulator transcription factor [Bacteroidales bacterium]HNZ43058.1 response regulator transcription factor [Bacteroidales bacterium]HOH83494.1 response regulator transcription factor [Bacteroidales bacterium]HPB25847.1 response regulator transcription factor [Bacteroidales bacterium]HPI30396.1 response regulator transcription factor [Bacteroidales bacterium]